MSCNDNSIIYTVLIAHSQANCEWAISSALFSSTTLQRVRNLSKVLSHTQIQLPSSADMYNQITMRRRSHYIHSIYRTCRTIPICDTPNKNSPACVLEHVYPGWQGDCLDDIQIRSDVQLRSSGDCYLSTIYWQLSRRNDFVYTFCEIFSFSVYYWRGNKFDILFLKIYFQPIVWRN